MTCWSALLCHALSCLPMIRPCPCSIRVAAGPRPDGCGAMQSTTGLGPDPPTRLPPMSTPRTARAAALPSTWPRSAVCFRSTVMMASSGSPWIARTVSVTLAFCWAHMRRAFYEFHVSTKSPLAAWGLAKVGELYAIETEIRGQPAEHRRRVRQERSRPIVEALHTWLQDHVGRVLAVSDLAKAMRYAIRHWPGLTVFLEDGRVEMDTNVVERAIRPNTF